MSSQGSSSTAGNKQRKGKEIMVEEVPPPVAEEKQQQMNGKQIMADSDESDSDSYSYLDDSDWESEVDEEEEQGRKKEIPVWLDTLLRTKFWDPCKEHVNMNRADQCMFCLKCYKVTCPRCTHREREPGHRRLKIRRYVYRSVVHASDMHDLGVDVSRIQTYVINQRKVLHLRPMNRSKHFRPQAGTPRCITCSTWLRSTPNLFCSLVCEENVDVSQDDFSGPEAELRYRSLQVNMLQAEPSEAAAEELPAVPEAEHPIPPAQVDEPPPPPAANQNASLRRRARKQAAPERSPFF